MADNIGNKAAHDYHLDIAPVQEGFYVKGAAHCDWGMKNRLSRLFDPKSGNTVMLAFDHGYIMGPTAGLERIDVVIPPLIPYVNVLMGTKGILRSCISPAAPVAKCVRVTYDTTVLFDEMSNGGGIACDIENAVRMNADCMAVQTFIGAPGESRSLELLCRTADAGARYGIPTLGVVAVGKQMERTEKFFQLATRVLAENGANVVKSYYCDGFERVAAACPVPIVIAGGKKLPELEALEMAYRAIAEGARGVDMAGTSSSPTAPPAWPRPSARWSTGATPPSRPLRSTRKSKTPDQEGTFMSAEYMHIGIPITNKKPGMTYNEGAKFWVSNVDDYDYKIEYLKFEEGAPFPEVLHRCPHVAYKVDSLEKYIADADSVICGPMQANDQGDQVAFVWKDGAILELYQPK